MNHTYQMDKAGVRRMLADIKKVREPNEGYSTKSNAGADKQRQGNEPGGKGTGSGSHIGTDESKKPRKEDRQVKFDTMKQAFETAGF